MVAAVAFQNIEEDSPPVMELFWANEGDGIVDPTPELVTSQASQKRSLLYIGALLYYECLYSCSLLSVFSVGGSGIFVRDRLRRHNRGRYQLPQQQCQFHAWEVFRLWSGSRGEKPGGSTRMGWDSRRRGPEASV